MRFQLSCEGLIKHVAEENVFVRIDKQMGGEGKFLEHILHKGELPFVLEMDHAGPKVCVKHVSKAPRRIEVP